MIKDERGTLVERICPRCRMLLLSKEDKDRHSPAVEDQIRILGESLGRR